MSRRNRIRFSHSAPALRRRRRGLSAILVVIVIMVLIVFVAMAVDYGRMRVTKVQLQNAADAGATAAATGLEFLPNGVVETQDRASDAAAENFSLDQANNGTGMRSDAEVDLIVDEDVEFGIWRDNPLPDQPQWTPLAQVNGGIDERRQANAVRVYGRRTSQFYDSDGNLVTRDTALPLIFGPVFGQATGNVQADATAAITGGRTGSGFIGLDWVKFNGTTKTDSYDADIESYPGLDGANKNSTIASNGDITLVGGTKIWGDAHPGVNGSIQPYPLGGSVEVTGYMDPLDTPLTAGVDYHIPIYQAPLTNHNNAPNAITNGALKGNGSFAPNGNATVKNINPAPSTQPSNFVFSSWTTGSSDTMTFDNTNGPINVWVNGNFKNGAQAEIHLKTNAYAVTLWINGDFNMQGGGLINDVPGGALPSNFNVNVTKANTSVDIGGSPNVYMHLNAPLSDIKIHGHGSGPALGFYGWAVGKSLFVTGNMEAHYDETLEPKIKPFTIRLVD